MIALETQAERIKTAQEGTEFETLNHGRVTVVGRGRVEALDHTFEADDIETDRHGHNATEIFLEGPEIYGTKFVTVADNGETEIGGAL